MTYKCVYCGVSSKSTDLSFHSFPKNQMTKNLWLNALSLADARKWDKIYSKHFQKENYFIAEGTKRFLLRDTVPIPDNNKDVCEVIQNKSIVCTPLTFMRSVHWRNMENEFNDRLNKILKVKKPNSKYLSKVKYEKLVLHLKELKTKKPKIPNDYRIIKKYDVVEVSNVERLVVPKMNEDDQIKCYVYNEELYSILHTTHLSTGHGRRDRMEHQLHSKYENITRETVMLYLNLCELCQIKGYMIKPITSTDNTNLRCQDLVDIQAQTDANNYKTHSQAIRESYKNNSITRKSGTSTAAKNKSKYNNSLSSLSDIRQDKRKKSNFSVSEKLSGTNMVSLIYSDIQIESFNQTDSTDCNEIYPEQTLQNTGSAGNVPPETDYQPKLGFKKLSGMRRGKDELREEQEELAIMEEMEEAKYNKNNPIQLFFQSMASTVMTFPPELAIETRKRVNDIVSEMELFANALRTKSMNKTIESINMPQMF